MATLRRSLSGRVAIVFLIVVLMVLHLLMVHGHDDVTTLEACIVLLATFVFAFGAGLASARPRPALSVSTVVNRLIPEAVVRRILPREAGMVMRL